MWVSHVSLKKNTTTQSRFKPIFKAIPTQAKRLLQSATSALNA